MSFVRNFSLSLSIVTAALLTGNALAASTDETAAQEAVKKAVKEPGSLKWGKFTPAGAKGACLTIYGKSSLTGLVGSQEAFLERTENGWNVLYVAEIASGHKGCIEEMSKR